MTADALLLAVAGTVLAAVAVAWLAQPLWRGDEPASAPDRRAVGFLATREAILAAIRDLDADLALGRVDLEDHSRRRGELVERGAQVLRALDRMQAEVGGEAARRSAMIETEVAARAAGRSRLMGRSEDVDAGNARPADRGGEQA